MKPIYKTISKWSILTALLAYTGWISVWARNQAEKEVCTGIEISVIDNPQLDTVIRRGVEAELSHYPEKIVGAPLTRLDIRKIRKYLGAMSNFESVSTMITAERKLLVEVVPMIPVMRVFTEGKSYYINREGKVIEAKPEFYTDVPIVKGAFSKGFQPKDLVSLMQYIAKDKFLSNLVSMVEAKDPNNLLLIPRIYGHVVNFGDTTRLADKTENLKIFYRRVIPHKGWNEYDTISVKFRDQVVATRRIKNLPVVAAAPENEVDLEEGTLPDVDPQDAE